MCKSVVITENEYLKYIVGNRNARSHKNKKVIYIYEMHSSFIQIWKLILIYTHLNELNYMVGEIDKEWKNWIYIQSFIEVRPWRKAKFQGNLQGLGPDSCVISEKYP